MLKKATWMTLLILSMLLMGCGGERNPELRTGRYLLDGNAENYSYVLLHEEGRFEFSRHMALSYVPMGTYEVREGRLILQAGADERYTFLIEEDTLIFQEGVPGILPQGSRFLLERSGP